MLCIYCVDNFPDMPSYSRLKVIGPLLLVNATETEKELCSKCDIVLMLIGHCENGFGEIKDIVTTDKTAQDTAK